MAEDKQLMGELLESAEVSGPNNWYKRQWDAKTEKQGKAAEDKAGKATAFEVTRKRRSPVTGMKCPLKPKPSDCSNAGRRFKVKTVELEELKS